MREAPNGLGTDAASESPAPGGEARARIARELDRHWLAWTLLAWAIIALWALWDRWNAVQWLSLGDTDDNMRLMQVRAWLGGQGWYDLRQYRLDPPGGLDIHWSRIVDLPLAGLILFFRLFTSDAWAERLACGIAPLLPLAVAMAGIAASVRRLIHPLAFPLALVMLSGASVMLLMFMPERIDHHGWQLAMLSLTVAGLTDPARRRGGAIVGLASATSLAIGLELLPYAAMAGAILTLRWVWDRDEAPRLMVYGLTLGGGTAAGFAAFASIANHAMRCDALTPVWLSVTVAAGALLVLLAWLNPERREARLGLALLVGAVLAGGFAGLYPQCLARPEGVSGELQRNWLSNVREAKPIYRHPFRTAFPIGALPVIGLIGAMAAAWRWRRTPAASGWVAVTLFAAFAVAMLLWQVRAGPAGQLLAIPGATALAWLLLPRLLGHRAMLVRVFGTVAGFLLVSGLFAGLVIRYLPVDRPKAYTKRVNAATGDCLRTTRLMPLDRYPRTTVFTFVDLGPRLITVTHHDGIAGPYHRNGDAILDVQHAFQRSPAEARAIMRRHGATLLLVCPNMAESTNYRARAPHGFYARLAKGETFPWLAPQPLPRGSPFRLFAVR